MKNIYEGNYKRLVLIPIALLLISLFIVFVYPKVSMGIDFTGGTRILLRTDAPIKQELFKAKLAEKYPLQELSITSTSNPSGGYGAVVQYSSNRDFTSAQEKIDLAEQLAPGDAARAMETLLSIQPVLSKYAVLETIKSPKIDEAISEAKTLLDVANEHFTQEIEEIAKKEFGITQISSQRREVGASLGKAFVESSFWMVAMAAFFIVIVVFAFFREIIPSAAILGAALIDIMFAVAMMAVLSIPFSLSSIASLLMLLGYSIDTDVLLTTRVLKRKEGTEKERAMGSVATGLTMTFTAIAALGVMLVLAYFYQIQVIFEIAAILIFGLLADIPATWLMNGPVLLWYAESKKGASR